MADTPFFSVIVPSYNRGQVIADTIQSVLNQEASDFELIIVDDGSTDNTREKLQAITDERVRYYYQENAERGAARNHGVRRARGKYVTFLDSDDLFYTNHLAEAKAALQKIPGAQFYFQPYEIVDTSGKRVRSLPRLDRDLNTMLVKQGNFMSCLGIFIERQLALAHPFREDRLLAGSEDYELWLRLAARIKMEHGNNVTAALVHHPDRSVYNFEAAPLIERKQRFIAYLKSDAPFMSQYGQYFDAIQAGAYSYIALHLPLDASMRKLRIKFALKAIRHTASVLFTKRFGVIVRQICLGR